MAPVYNRDRSNTIMSLLYSWNEFPALRLGQFLDALVTMMDAPDLFYISDEELVARAQEFARTYRDLTD